MKVDFRWNKPLASITAEYTGDDAQLYLAKQAQELMEPYVPSKQGESGSALSGNVRVYVENGKGIVHYLSPYARYQYEGKVMISKRPGVKGSAKKILQPEKSLNYTKFRHPLATSHWDQAMLTAHQGDLTQAMQNYIGGRR